MNTIENEKRQRQEERFSRKSRQTNAKYLRRVEELKGMPEALAPFMNILKDVYVEMKLPEVLEGKKLIGTYCVMAPQELAYAAGAVPVKLCSGSYTAFSVGDDLAPRDACPLVKAVAGFGDNGQMPIYEACSMIARDLYIASILIENDISRFLLRRSRWCESSINTTRDRVHCYSNAQLYTALNLNY